MALYGDGGRVYAVGDGADAVDLQLDGLAGLDPAVVLEAAAAGHRARGDHVAGVEALAGGGVGEHRAERVLRVRGGALAPQLPVDAHAAAHRRPVRDGV